MGACVNCANTGKKTLRVESKLNQFTEIEKKIEEQHADHIPALSDQNSIEIIYIIFVPIVLLEQQQPVFIVCSRDRCVIIMI